MATVGDLIFELERSEELSDLVLSDLTIIGNISAATQLFTGAYLDLNLLTENTVDNLNKTATALTLTAKLPYVGLISKLAGRTIKKLEKPFEEANDALDTLEGPISALNTTAGGVGAGTFVGSTLTFGVQGVNGERQALLQFLNEDIELELLAPLESDDSYEALRDANDITAAVVATTEPLRQELAVLDYSAFDAFTDIINSFNDTVEEINDQLDSVADLVDEIDDAIEPVRWALNASNAVQEKVFDPVLEAILGATGINSLLNDLVGNLNPASGLIDEFLGTLDRMKVVLDENDIGGLLTDFWSDFSPIFATDGPFEDILNLDPIQIDNGDGSFSFLGSVMSDTLVGTDGNDNFAPLRGDDLVQAGGGTDQVFFANSIDEYTIRALEDGAGEEYVEVAARKPGESDEGIDRLYDMELFQFNTPGLGPVTIDEIREFQFVSPGDPDLTGSDGDDWLIGDGRANELRGGAGDDRLIGAAGNDLLLGEAGEDLVFGGDGNDRIIVDPSTGIDLVFGGDGQDRVIVDHDEGIIVDFATGAIEYGSLGSGIIQDIEEVQGTAGDDTFLGGDTADTAITNGGNDIFLYAGEGDTVIGPDDDEPGADGVVTVSFAAGGYLGVRVVAQEGTNNDGNLVISHSSLPDYDLGNPNATDLQNVDVVEGTQFADVFYGLGVTEGQIGDSREFEFEYEGQTYNLTGSAFMGGGGTDVFFASEKASLFDGGEGYDIVNFNLDYILAEPLEQAGVQSYIIDLERGVAEAFRDVGPEKSDIQLFNIEGVVGTRGDDIITGNGEDNYLFGYLGDDTIIGGAGADYIDASGLTRADLQGGDGNDVIALGPANDATIDGGDGIDALEVKPDQAFRLDAYFEDNALGSETAPLVNVAGWDIDLEAGTATSQFYDSPDLAGNQPFTYTALVDNVENVLGSDFDDTISGDDSDNLLKGREGDDLLTGRGGDDFLDGGLGSDTLIGGEGNDVLIANGSGSEDRLEQDVLTGGAGADRFGFLSTDGPALITDFTPGEDLLDFRATDAGFDDLAFDTVAGAAPPGAAASGAATTVTYQGQVMAVLHGVDAGQLSQEDFVFGAKAEDDVVSIDLRDGGEIPSLLVNDTASDDGTDLNIIAINGSDIAPGESVELDSGARIEMDADRNLFLRPDGAYDAFEPVTESFEYTIEDDSGATASANATLNVTNTNALPVTEDDEATVEEDGEVLISPLENDVDPDGDPLSLSSASAVNGTVTIEDEMLRYAPDEDFFGDDEILYTVDDGFGGITEGRVGITVSPVADNPIAQNDSGETEEDTAAIFSPLDNDTDPDGNTLSLTDASAQNGVVNIIGDQLEYIPNPDFFGEDEVLYETTNESGLSSSASLFVTVSPLNDAPEPQDDMATTGYETPVTLNVLDNDTDPDGDELSVVSATAQNGAVDFDANGVVTYTPAEGYSGTDEISYSVSDGLETVEALAMIEVEEEEESLPPVTEEDDDDPFAMLMEAVAIAAVLLFAVGFAA